MLKSPLIAPITLIFTGVLAFLATTGILPAELLRFAPVVFVILGFVALVSLNSEDLMSDLGTTPKKSSTKARSTSKPTSKTVASEKKTTKAPVKTAKKKATKPAGRK